MCSRVVKAYRVRVWGRVQRVGFRRYVLDLAQDLGLKGYVKNLHDGSVEIFVQGVGEQLSRFLKMVGEPPLPAEVREVDEEGAAVRPEIEGFRIVYGEWGDELQEGFGAMQTVFTEYWKEFRDYRQEFRDYREGFRDYREEFKDFAGRTDENFRLMSERYGEISEGLEAILETLVRESRETRVMLNETMKALREAIEKLSK